MVPKKIWFVMEICKFDESLYYLMKIARTSNSKKNSKLGKNCIKKHSSLSVWITELTINKYYGQQV